MPGAATPAAYLRLLSVPFGQASFLRAVFISFLIIVGQTAVVVGF